MLRGDKGDAISAVNLSGNTGTDLDTFLLCDGKTKYAVESCNLLNNAMYNYILYDAIDSIVYAVQSIDLEFV
jgi:hypothetical protein